jgi:N-acetylneuraminate epimerase
MKRDLSRVTTLLCGLLSLLMTALQAELIWDSLPRIPDKEGFAGSFAGVINDQLIVAGGANFPDAKPWEGGTKVWYDHIWSLDGKDWTLKGKLPRALGYGASASIKEGVILAGGSDAAGHSREVYLLDHDLKTQRLPDLPLPCANCSGALIRRTFYIAGGIERPDSTEALHTFWALDLDAQSSGWKTLPPWPGSARMLAAAGALDDAFYLVGGAALKKGADDKPERIWLTDAYRYDDKIGWEKLPGLPAPRVAAPSPMPSVRGQLLLIGGDDGFQLQASPTEHKGFPTTVLTLKGGSWKEVGRAPSGLVTTSTTKWQGKWVIPGGEIRPGTRSTEVLMLKER